MLSIVAGLALSVMPLDFNPPPKPLAFDVFGRATRLYAEEFRRLQQQPRTQPRPMPPADPDDKGTTPGQSQPPTPTQPTQPVPPMPPAIDPDEEGGVPPAQTQPPFPQPQANILVPPSPPAIPAINGYWRPTAYGWRWTTLPPGFPPPPPPPNFNIPPLPVEYMLPYYHYYHWLYGDSFYGRNFGGFRTRDGFRIPHEFYRNRRGYYDLPPIPFWPR